MTGPILDQLARSGLLPSDLATTLLGGVAPTEEIALALVIGSMDAEAMVRGDSTSTWNDRWIARQGLILAFMSALVLAN
jgi:hypothetical protein